MATYTFLHLAAETLLSCGTPMTAQIKKFINDVQIDINAFKEHPSEYDHCPSLDELASLRGKWGVNS